MAVIGTLAVSLIAKSQEFVSGVAKAREAVVDFTMAIPGMEFACSRAGHVIEALAAGELVHLLHSTAENIDKLAKLSDRLGTTTESIAGLDHAARMSGSSAEAMNAALDRLARGLGKAEEGGKAAQAALAHLGLSFEDLLGKDPAEQMRIIAEKVNALGTQEEKVAATTNLFGKSAAELVNVLARGRVGLDEMQKEAERLGITFSRVDAAKVEAAHEALTRVHEVIEGALQRTVIELAPYIEAVANKFTEWATAGGGAGKKIVDAVEFVVKALARTAQVVSVVVGIFRTFGGAVATAVFGVLRALNLLLEGLEKVANVLPGVNMHWAKDTGKFLQEATEGAMDLTAAGVKQIATSGEQYDAAVKLFDEIKAGAQRAAEAVGAVSEEHRKGAAAGAAASAAAAELGEAEAKAAKEAEAHAKALERQKESLEQRTADLEFTAGLTKDERKYSAELLEIEKARKNNWDELASRLSAALQVKRDEAAEEERAKTAEKLREQRDLLDDSVAAREKLGALAKDERQWASELLEIEKARAKGFDDLADRLQKILEGKKAELAIEREQKKLEDEKKKNAEEAARKAKAATDLLKSMNQEIALLQAGNGLARDRVRIQQELDDNMEKAGKNEAARDAARLLAAEKLKALEEGATAAKEKSAAADKSSGSSRGGGGGGGGAGGSDSHLAGANRRGGRRADGHSKGDEPFMHTFGGVRVYDREAEWKKQHALEVAAANEELRRDPFAFSGNRGDRKPATASSAAAAPPPSTSTGAGSAAPAAHPMPDPSPELKRANEALDKLKEVLSKEVDELKTTGDHLEELVKVATEGFDAAKGNEEKLAQGVGEVKAAVGDLKAALAAISQAIGGH